MDRLSKRAWKSAALRTLRKLHLEQPARRLQEFSRPDWFKRSILDDKNLLMLLNLFLPRDANCVDIGANVGSILAGMVEAAPDGSHVAFEPIPWLADGLAERFPNVEVRREAISQGRGNASFAIAHNKLPRSGLLQTVQLDVPFELITVETARLDDVLAVPPTFVKIDVEGAELEVLVGARETLRRYQPIVAFEHGHRGTPDTGRSSAVYEEFERAGLRLFDLEGRHLSRNDFLDVYVAGSRWNFIAHR